MNDLAFLKVANFACFVRELAAISPQWEQTAPHFGVDGVRTCGSRRDGMTVTSSRLDKLGTFIGDDPNLRSRRRMSRGAGVPPAVAAATPQELAGRMPAPRRGLIDFRVDRGRV